MNVADEKIFLLKIYITRGLAKTRPLEFIDNF